MANFSQTTVLHMCTALHYEYASFIEMIPKSKQYDDKAAKESLKTTETPAPKPTIEAYSCDIC